MNRNRSRAKEWKLRYIRYDLGGIDSKEYNNGLWLAFGLGGTWGIALLHFVFHLF